MGCIIMKVVVIGGTGLIGSKVVARPGQAGQRGGAQKAGVGHYVALSFVGTERLPESAYLRAKMTQEQLISSSTMPCSLVHATRFSELASGSAYGSTGLVSLLRCAKAHLARWRDSARRHQRQECHIVGLGVRRDGRGPGALAEPPQPYRNVCGLPT
jgi:hypothetical protein